jgi:membrane protein
MPRELKTLLIALKEAFTLLSSKDPLVLSSSTAFFATFSLSPIIIILVSLFGLYPESERINNHLFRSIGSIFGRETAMEIESIVRNFLSIESNWLITLAGSIFFIFVATTLLRVIKHAIQKIWHIRPKPSLRLKYHSRERGTHLGFILFTGVLFLVSVAIDTSLGISLDYLQSVWPNAAIVMVRLLSLLFSVIMVTIWFTALFKILPEANIPWYSALNGGLLTGILYTIGKFVLGKVLVYARIATIFGASASFALMLLFVFYCSFILYYGAAFTYQYSEMNDVHICAGKYADEYEERIKALEARSREPEASMATRKNA